MTKYFHYCQIQIPHPMFKLLKHLLQKVWYIKLIADIGYILYIKLLALGLIQQLLQLLFCCSSTQIKKLMFIQDLKARYLVVVKMKETRFSNYIVHIIICCTHADFLHLSCLSDWRQPGYTNVLEPNGGIRPLGATDIK